jgi:phenylalanyl-tRNA synthetase beta subunit
VSFWLPENQSFSSNDFNDLVREVGGSVVEQVNLFSFNSRLSYIAFLDITEFVLMSYCTR